MTSPRADDRYLRSTAFLDANHPDVVAFARGAAGGQVDDVARAVALYLAVRDGIRYDASHIDLASTAMRASATLARRTGFCVAKAVLLAAAGRALGLRTRLGFADVRNHLSTPRMRRAMGTDLFVFHGYAELWLNGRWVKATPAFDRAFCERFGVEPLAFDGRCDSLFQPADRAGRRHLEYVHDRGPRDDLPLDEIRRTFAEQYPGLMRGDVYDVRWGNAADG